MNQSFSMGVRQRRDVRNSIVPLISDFERAVLGALGSTEPESMKVLAYNLLRGPCGEFGVNGCLL